MWRKTVAKNECREAHPERCGERNEWFAIRCAASPLREERGCAAREQEDLRAFARKSRVRVQTMLPVWRNK
ncbi:MAG: hypothetical protein C0448_12010 [Sphingobacteriaceae bacterium]|nr:hypothetical protein [Sphingobacteriaceae bacterium]